MERMTDISQEYLNDFEILRDARLQLESELEQWWQQGVMRDLLSSLRSQFRSEFNPREYKKSNPGKLELRFSKNDTYYLSITDPRTSGIRDYKLRIEAKKKAVDKLRKSEALSAQVEDFVRDLNQSRHYIDDGCVVEAYVEISGDDPIGTMKNLSVVAEKMFRLTEVVAQGMR